MSSTPLFIRRLLAFLRSLLVIHTGTHTEYGGAGRVHFVSFFRGAGYCLVLRAGRGRDGKPLDAPGWRPNIEIRGFTIYWRTCRSTFPRPGTVARVRITCNPNQAVC